MPTLRSRKVVEAKETADAMVVDSDDAGEPEYDSANDRESDADFEGSPAKAPRDEEEARPAAPPMQTDGGASQCAANTLGDGAGTDATQVQELQQPKDIRRLDPLVINQIAAGEVITKPPNALKELLENALDAGATTISVEAAGGGLDRIRICDDGCGIRQTDLPLLCERHATSKLKKFADLEDIATFGFRGEALASVSYVAKVHVVTKCRGDQCAFKQSFRDGAPIDQPKACAGPDGTTITVEDMFFNFKVRRKVLQGSASEQYQQILKVCGAYAIHYASKSISCRRADKGSDLVTTGGSTVEAICAVHGSDVASDVTELKMLREGTDEQPLDFSLYGYVSKRCLESTRGAASKRDRFTLFINDRLVDSTAIKRCVDETYANRPDRAASTTSKPFAYLSLKVPGAHVDVNVHPTKKEVHFLYEAELCAALQKDLEKVVAKHADSRRLVDLTDKPSRRKTQDYALQSQSQPSQKRPSTQPSQRPEKMIRSDYRDQHIDAFFPASQVELAPPPKAVQAASSRRDTACTQESPEDWFDSQDDEPDLAARDGPPPPLPTPPPDTPEDAAMAPARPLPDAAASAALRPPPDGAAGAAPRPDADAAMAPARPPFLSQLPDAGAGRPRPPDGDAAMPDAEAAAAERARRNLRDAGVMQEVGQSQATNLTGDRCKTCGSLKESLTLAETPGAFASSRSAREALIDDNKKCPECGAVKADAILVPPPPRPRKFVVKDTTCAYDSVQEMLDDLKARRPRVASAEALRTHVYVGNVDASRSLIQHGTKLSMVNHLLLSRELFAQLSLRQFGEVDYLEFAPPHPVVDLIAAHLQACEAEVISDAQIAASDALDRLKSKSGMLKEYFGVGIDDQGLLTHMPVLLQGHAPDPSAIPGFLWRLATETEWRYEKRCFEDVVGHLGVCYAQLPLQDIGGDMLLTSEGKETLEKVLFPALKQLLLPPAGLDDDACIDTLTTLERLYRQFERC